MAGVEQEDAGGDQLLFVQLARLVRRRDQLRDEVVARRFSPLGDEIAQIGGEGARRRGGAVLDGARHAELVHRHHRMRPREELVGHLDGRAEEARDGHHRNRLGEGGDEVVRAVLAHQGRPLLGQGRDRRREPLDRARDERAVDEAAQARVLGRFERQQRAVLDRLPRGEMLGRFAPAQFLAGHHMQNLPAKSAVAQQRGHLGMAEATPVPILLPEEGGRRGADGLVGRVGVLEERRIARIEPHAPRGRVDLKAGGLGHASANVVSR